MTDQDTGFPSHYGSRDGGAFPMRVGSKPDIERPQSAAETDPAVKAAGSWVGQLARTLKTCRLYDANNPTVIRFREELAHSLRKALDETGPWTLRFTSDDVLLDDLSLYPARSREDNLALPFYRDGLRSLTLEPGIEVSEVQAILDGLLQVTGQNLAQDDLVTLLWEANLTHVEIDYVPAEGDAGSPGDSPTQEERDPMPWPLPAAAEPEEEAVQAVTGTEESAVPGRSDDWSMGQDTLELEAEFESLLSLSDQEIARFQQKYHEEHDASLVSSTLAMMRAFLAADAQPQDRQDLGGFLPRVIRLSISRGAWLEAREGIGLLRACGGDAAAALEGLAQELLQPISIAGAVEHVDKQEAPQVLEFLALAKELGETAVDWLNLVLADSQQRRNRRLLAEAIAGLCRQNPERLAPWLSDPRWFVVRNVVHILAWIGGPNVVGLLRVAARHADPRVRTEVVAALSQVEPRLARPILLDMIEGVDARLFCSILHQLSAERSPDAAKLLLKALQDPRFEQRTPEEQRAIYSALGSTGGDGEVTELEAELLKGSWFARHDAHRQQVARVLARIGTPLARELLERHVSSKRSAVRKACEEALQGLTSRE